MGKRNGGVNLKRFMVVVLALALMVGGSVSALAQSFELDALGFMGLGNAIKIGAVEKKTNDFGFAASARAELFNNVVVEGRYLMSNATKVDENGEMKDLGQGVKIGSNLILGGLSYRVLSDNEMSVYAGIGYAMAQGFAGKDKESTYTGQGIFGRVGLSFEISRQISVHGDVVFSPKSKFDMKIPGDTKDVEGTIMSGQGRIVYSLNDMFGVQAGFSRSDVRMKSGAVEGNLSSTLFGAGVVMRF